MNRRQKSGFRSGAERDVIWFAVLEDDRDRQDPCANRTRACSSAGGARKYSKYSTLASFSNFKNSLKSLGRGFSAKGHLPIELHGAQTLHRRLGSPVPVIGLAVQVRNLQCVTISECLARQPAQSSRITKSLICRAIIRPFQSLREHLVHERQSGGAVSRRLPRLVCLVIVYSISRFNWFTRF